MQFKPPAPPSFHPKKLVLKAVHFGAQGENTSLPIWPTHKILADCGRPITSPHVRSSLTVEDTSLPVRVQQSITSPTLPLDEPKREPHLHLCTTGKLKLAGYSESEFCFPDFIIQIYGQSFTKSELLYFTNGVTNLTSGEVFVHDNTCPQTAQ
ncbi:hypothetical protein J437_LFUL001260 [Ladona fulva]|uniref:Uncharacterized protein n=1 Tax=Ladona fulva TaxID=123851 RepID=A0A8K0NWE1_LADFU|nr:hypothetical protein J437_LFUL001260 [Ladona fulva]